MKGINLLNALYQSAEASIPEAFEIIGKEESFWDQADGKMTRRGLVSKNEHMRAMPQTCLGNQLKCRYVLMDSWFAATENPGFIRGKNKHFIAALKDNRLVALSEQARRQGRWERMDELEPPDRQAVRGHLKGYEQEVLLVRRVFTNKDGSIATLNLVCSELALTGGEVCGIHRKRWKVEECHKSLKSNASLGAPPTRRERTQQNHMYLSMLAVFKLESLKLKTRANHFALRAKLHVEATRSALRQLLSLSTA